ncbi:hypothetical protein BGX33_009539 [Mortierella sp. NVP41]|nr:hypothetical protein BGX33_009539 [Mortierella sp. NVP41]
MSATVRDEIHQVFTPKDLVALSSVNRLSYSVLTPLLWATYHEPTYKPHDPNLLAFRPSAYFYSPPALDVVRKNSPYFRSLDLSNYESRYFRKPELLKLKCTHLQELQLSPNVSLPLARKLIKDNPGLRMLDWKRSFSIDHSSRHYAKLDTLLSLHQLRYLGLEGWNLDSVFLHRVLANNAGTLEELNLGSATRFIDQPRVNVDWNGLADLSLATMSEEQVVANNQLIQGRSLVLPKVKTLHLDLMNEAKDGVVGTTQSLVRVCPALETLMVRGISEEAAWPLSRNIRELCPHLRSIQNSGLCVHHLHCQHYSDDGFASLVEACAPGNLVHCVLNVWGFSSRLSDALLVHRDGLETLELTFRGSIDNTVQQVNEVLKQSKRLKRFVAYNYDYYCLDRTTLRLLKGLDACQTLESLTLARFPYSDFHARYGSEEEGIETGSATRGKQSRSPSNLLSDWHQVPSIGYSEFKSPANELKNMVFEAIARLRALRVLELDGARFERTLPYSQYTPL